MITNRRESVPTRTTFDVLYGHSGTSYQYQGIGLALDDGLQTDLRPLADDVVRDRLAPGSDNDLRDKCIFANGDDGVIPDWHEDMYDRPILNTRPNRIQSTLQLGH